MAALALIVAVLIVAVLAVGSGAWQMVAPFAAAQPSEISLAPAASPNYARRTTLRMLLALGVSLVFTFTYRTLAAKSRHAEMVLVPLFNSAHPPNSQTSEADVLALAGQSFGPASAASPHAASLSGWLDVGLRIQRAIIGQVS